MEVSITQFRREMFDLVNKAMDGSEVWVVHKGRRFRIAPDAAPSRLSRLTPLEVINPESQSERSSLLEEMAQAWEKDWANL
jgi:antitoxin (DNA-binding transcriptional repressor) of toxin-antitoxin stability system